MALQRVWMPSPNYSSRGGAKVRLIVLHTAEGARTKESLGNYFASSSSGVSSHVGIDDSSSIAEYVKRPNKAWTQGNANPVAVSVELCAFANWSAAEWDRHPTMLSNCAQWIAEESAYFGVPIRKLSPADAQGGGVGVCQHRDLGSWGGGHTDCGPAFPIDRVLQMASGAPTPPKPEPKVDDEMVVLTQAPNGGWVVLDMACGEYRGLSSQALLDWYKNQGVKTAARPPSWERFKQVGTI